MSRSKGDKRGGHDAGEVLGHNAFAVVDGRLIKRIGGEEVDRPRDKREAKTRVTRLRRREAARIIADQAD